MIVIVLINDIDYNLDRLWLYTTYWIIIIIPNHDISYYHNHYINHKLHFKLDFNK